MAGVIIDSHVHVLPDRVRADVAAVARDDTWFGACHPPDARTASPVSLLGAMDRQGVDRAVCFTWPFADPGRCREANDFIARVVRQHSTRLIGFGIVQPDDPGAADEVRRCAGMGLRGIGELNADAQAFDPLGQGAARVAAACVETRLIWSLHCSEPVGHDYRGKGTFTPDRLWRLLERQPDLTVIAAHLGGGLPLYADMPEVRRVMDRCYVDTAAQPFLYQPTVYRTLVDRIGAGRILFGSDHPLLERPRYDAAFEAAGLARTDREAILGGNAAALFDLA